MIKQYVTTASMVCTMAFGFSGSAFAAENVTLDKTGQDSVNKVEINNSDTVEVKNTNNVEVLNLNVQSAKSGNVEANKNTSIEGSVGSGDASNKNTVKTDVSISNVTHKGVTHGNGNGGNGNGGNGNGGGSTVGAGNGAGTTVTPGKGRGNVLGAANFGRGAGDSVLPEVGAKFPLDVSALRNLAATPDNTLAKGSSLFTNAMLLTATLLSLLGAVGSAWWTKRREERI